MSFAAPIENASIEKIYNYDFIYEITYGVKRLDGSKVDLDINLVESRLVRQIKIHGNHPFLSKEISRLVPLQPGTIYENHLLEESKILIDDFLTSRGFYNSKVSVTAERHEKHPLVDIQIEIERGEAYRVGEIEIEGNTVFPRSRLLMEIFPYSRFQDYKLRKAMKSIQSLYAEEGYVRARAKVIEQTFHHDTHRVDLLIQIRENKDLQIEFSGNPIFRWSRLRDALGFDERRSYDSYAIKRGEQRLERYFANEHYPDAVVTSSVEKEGETIFVDYHIEPGKRVELYSIGVRNNKEVSDKKMAKVIQSVPSGFFSPGDFNKALIEQDRVAVIQKYREEGYLEAQVSEPVVTSNDFGDRRHVAFEAKEGRQFTLKSLDVVGLPDDVEYKPKKFFLEVGRDYTSKRLNKSRARLLTWIQAAGYAYAEIETIKDTNYEDATVGVTFNVTPGPKVRVKDIIIQGNYQTRLSTIRKNIELERGGLFNYQKLLDSQLALRRLGVFQTVRVEPIGFNDQDTEILVFVRLQERKDVAVNFRVGYDNRTSYRTEVNVTKRNLFGLAKQLNARGVVGVNFQRAETTFLAPRIFGLDLNFANQYFLQFEDAPNYEAVSYGGNVSALKTFGSVWTLVLRNQITRTNYFLDGSSSELQSSLGDTLLNELRFITYFDKRDNFADPTKGIYLVADNEVNTDINDVRSNFNIFQFGASHYTPVASKIVLSNSFRYGHGFKLSDTATIPAKKLFFLGGSDTVRGFSEDSADPGGGTVRFLYNAELQYTLANGFKFAGFFDAGVLSNGMANLNLDETRESVGVGLRYTTPVGPLRLDYGFVLDRKPGDPYSRLHFSFGYFF